MTSIWRYCLDESMEYFILILILTVICVIHIEWTWDKASNKLIVYFAIFSSYIFIGLVVCHCIKTKQDDQKYEKLTMENLAKLQKGFFNMDNKLINLLYYFSLHPLAQGVY
jgi:hypothetical protein